MKTVATRTFVAQAAQLEHMLDQANGLARVTSSATLQTQLSLARGFARAVTVIARQHEAMLTLAARGGPNGSDLQRLADEFATAAERACAEVTRAMETLDIASLVTSGVNHAVQ